MNRAEINDWISDVADSLGVKLLVAIAAGGITWAAWISHEMTTIKVDVAEIKGHLHGVVAVDADSSHAHLIAHKAKEAIQ